MPVVLYSATFAKDNHEAMDGFSQLKAHQGPDDLLVFSESTNQGLFSDFMIQDSLYFIYEICRF